MIDFCSDIRRLSADDRKKNVYAPVINLIEGSYILSVCLCFCSILSLFSRSDISRIAHSMYDTDLARKDYSDTIRNALNVIQRYKFIFHLPQTIERSVKRVNHHPMKMNKT